MKEIQKTILNTVSIVFLSIYLVACGASENQIQTAIAQTEAARPTETNTVLPTATITPTFTPTLTPSPTFTLTFTPTPTPDLRIIDIGPKEFLLSKDDFPKEGKYYLPNYLWISPHHNSEIISGWGREKGLEYLERTGRIDGWWIYHNRGVNSLRIPEEIFHNIIQFETAEGAQIAVLEFNLAERGDFSYVERNLELGDINVVIISKEMQPNGKYHVRYEIDIAYRNYVSIVRGFGWEDDVVYDYVEDIARIALEKLTAAPLIAPYKQSK